jgi:hypothetical protein
MEQRGNIYGSKRLKLRLREQKKNVAVHLGQPSRVPTSNLQRNIARLLQRAQKNPGASKLPFVLNQSFSFR